MTRSLLVTALCLRNLAGAVRLGHVSPAVTAQTIEALAEEVEAAGREVAAQEWKEMAAGPEPAPDRSGS